MQKTQEERSLADRIEEIINTQEDEILHVPEWIKRLISYLTTINLSPVLHKHAYSYDKIVRKWEENIDVKSTISDKKKSSLQKLFKLRHNIEKLLEAEYEYWQNYLYNIKKISKTANSKRIERVLNDVHSIEIQECIIKKVFKKTLDIELDSLSVKILARYPQSSEAIVDFIEYCMINGKIYSKAEMKSALKEFSYDIGNIIRQGKLPSKDYLQTIKTIKTASIFDIINPIKLNRIIANIILSKDFVAITINGLDSLPEWFRNELQNMFVYEEGENIKINIQDIENNTLQKVCSFLLYYQSIRDIAEGINSIAMKNQSDGLIKITKETLKELRDTYDNYIKRL